MESFIIQKRNVKLAKHSSLLVPNIAELVMYAGPNLIIIAFGSGNVWDKRITNISFRFFFSILFCVFTIQ